MKYLIGFLIIILSLNTSCNKSKTTKDVNEVIDSIKIDSSRIVNTIGETLIPKAKKELANWKEYQNLDEFMLKYYNISTMEALVYSKELSDLVKLMKDTIKVDKLNTLNVIARFNVLHNEALRLADMAKIPSITEEEVNEEVGKILNLYASVNSKINTIYKAEDLQNSLEIDTETPIELEPEHRKPTIRKIPTRISSKKDN